MKRKLAGLLSLTMILSSMSVNVFAEDVPSDVTGAGEAEVNSIDTAVYRIVLPTTKNLNYIVDPQGLAQLGESGEQIIGDLDSGKGIVYSSGDVAIANRSSKDVKVTATVTATEAVVTDDEITAGKVKVNVADDITANDVKNTAAVQLYVVADEASFAVAAANAEGAKSFAESASTTGAATSGNYVVETSTKKVSKDKTGYLIKSKAGTDDTTTHEVVVPVLLKKADYVAKATTSNGKTTYSYAIEENSVGGAVSYSIAGKCTANDEWDTASTNIKSPTIGVTYHFDTATVAESGELGSNLCKVSVGNDVSSLTNLQTSPLVMVNVDDDDVTVDTEGITFSIAANADSEATPAVTSLTIGGEPVTGATATVDADAGKITVAKENAFNVSSGTEVIAKVSFDGKLYVAKGSVVIAPTAATATATTEAITVDVPDGVTLTAIDDVTSISVKKGSTDVTVEATLNDDKDKIILTPSSDLTAEDKLTITFTIGETNYKTNEVTVVEANVASTATVTTNANGAKVITLTEGSGEKAFVTFKEANVNISSGGYGAQNLLSGVWVNEGYSATKDDDNRTITIDSGLAEVIDDGQVEVVYNTADGLETVNVVLS